MANSNPIEIIDKELNPTRKNSKPDSFLNSQLKQQLALEMTKNRQCGGEYTSQFKIETEKSSVNASSETLVLLNTNETTAPAIGTNSSNKGTTASTGSVKGTGNSSKVKPKKETSKQGKPIGSGSKQSKAAVSATASTTSTAPVEVAATPEQTQSPANPEVIENTQILQTLQFEQCLPEYGNNLFQLQTKDTATDEEVRFVGVLKTLPSFGLGTSWVSGPGAAITDFVRNYLCSDLLDMLSTVGGCDRSWIAMDEQTDRTFDNTSQQTFNLDFRIYTTENIGSTKLTDYKTWRRALVAYSTPNTSNKINVNAITNNIVNGIGNAAKNAVNGLITIGKKIIDAGKELIEQKGSWKTNIGNAFEKVINVVVDQLTIFFNKSLYANGVNRVNSKSNRYSRFGAKLWNLKIYPWLFKKDIPVYISDWNMTFSKEYNPSKQEPVYIDFSIKCNIDQIVSSSRWFKTYLNETNFKPLHSEDKNITEELNKELKDFNINQYKDEDYKEAKFETFEEFTIEEKENNEEDTYETKFKNMFDS